MINDRLRILLDFKTNLMNEISDRNMNINE